MGRDDRGPLTTMGPAIGLSAEEIHRIRQTIGHIYCPRTKYHNGANGSAALISNGQIITAAHMLYDKQGRPRAPWSACYFEAQTGGKMSKIPLEFGKGKSYFGSTYPARSLMDQRRDIVILSLKNRVNGVRPFHLSSRPITMGEKIYGISASQIGYQKDWREPIVVTCEPQQLFAADGYTPTGYYSDCDSERGASGGVNLVRRNGELVIAGISVDTGLPDKNYQPYNPDAKSFTYSIGIDGQLARRAADLAKIKLKNESELAPESTSSNKI